MAKQNASRSNGTPDATTVTLLPWHLAEIRRQLYVDLMSLAEHISKEANGASQMNLEDSAQTVLGADLRAFIHTTFADTVAVLDQIGWDLDGDTAVLMARNKSLNEGLES